MAARGILAAFVFVIGGMVETVRAAEITSYRLMCDASAAVELDVDHFIVGNDELNTLRIYKRGVPDPVRAVDLAKFLGTKPDKESDLEGAARIGNRIFWISSHALKKDTGEVQERRRRFFATDIVQGTGSPSVTPVGSKFYGKLVADLSAVSGTLADAANKKPEEKGGLNIEGLAATPQGRLLIGFRNPLENERALLVEIENPNDMIAGNPAKLGKPFTLWLGNRGIRSIELVGNSYVIVAGPIDGEGTFQLYRWSGAPGADPTEVSADIQGLRPEVVFAVSKTNALQILSDDGELKVDGEKCKDAPQSKQAFRSITITP